VIYSHKALTSVEDGADELDLPPSYADLICFNLAESLAVELSRQVDPTISKKAAYTLSVIRRVNAQPIYMKSDGFNSRGFNIYTGDE
jgi:hypothetical protein